MAGTEHRRPRVLIEDDHPALEISDFAAFREAGFDVAFCTGPRGTPGSCALLRGADCEVLAGADVVLHGLGPECGVAAGIRWWHPEVPVIVKADPAAAPAGCASILACCSVGGQVAAVRRTLQDAARDDARENGPRED